MTRLQTWLAALALGLAVTAALVAERAARDAPVEARFWFDGIAFSLPRRVAPIDPLSPEELAAIEGIARTEVAIAFDGLRLRLDGGPRAPYQVRVVQDFPVRVGPQRMAAAESIALGPLGNHGWVSFRATAGLALRHAAPIGDRAGLVESIGRGIGRVAAHEFAHQILNDVDLHAATDRASYEYASADRPQQFQGPMRWSFARPLLAERVR